MPDADSILVGQLSTAGGTGTRRERLRRATVAEIKRLAWAQVAVGGALGVSLRAIAREMGMTSSGIYRYFDSREQLVYQLIGDGYESLADTLEAAAGQLPAGTDAAEKFMHLARSHRHWSLTHSTEYALVFGTPICGPEVDPRIAAEHTRGVAVLFQVMIDGIQDGCIDPRRIGSIPRGLTRQLRTWQEQLQLPLGSSALAACLYIWAQLHGAISIELFQGLPPELVPGDQLFEMEMRTALAAVGHVGSGSGPGQDAPKGSRRRATAPPPPGP
jgi:AcrR family transcriptional regulator